jgi:hypothetical protein
VTLARLASAAQEVGLTLRGAFHPNAHDGTPEGTQTLVLLGPDEPAFWAIFTSSPEYLDASSDPLDRWSKRVATGLAGSFGGTAIFPYDGPPYPPFLRWAERSGACWSSPVGLLVHKTAGLFISYRAALALPERLGLDASSDAPCSDCDARPCENACPVGALAPDQPYDVVACKAHLRSAEGADCRSGCLVRRACPVSQRFGRLPEQSAFHMRAFLGE